ncbi:hypothetical protein BD413DRAFT_563891 [Trametes elegans]|nr:hypothetical protein BD413DRAFT_563891 [Trametes elegans]
MPSPVRALAPTVSPVTNVPNAKRALDDSDTEQRDAKRAKLHSEGIEQDVRKDTKEKKKRRKRKRKVSIVHAQGVSDAGGRAMPAASGSRPQSMSNPIALDEPDATVLKSKANTEESVTLPSSPAGPSVAAMSREPSPAQSTSSKGKERATEDDVAAENSRQQITDLQGQVSAKASLVSQHENLLSSFQQSLSCQICLDLMHKPFALAPCGHSACFQCLVNWFKAPPPDVPANEVLPVWLRKKTCPHCRTAIRDRPIEIWTIKEMVASLVKSGLAPAPLLPPLAAADAPAAANADPWAGIFRPAPHNQGVFPDGQPPALLQQLIGLRDDEDGGIYRCIDCHHEIWDGACSECGRVYPGHDPQGPAPEDLDEDVEMGHWGGHAAPWDDDMDEDDDDDFIDDVADVADAWGIDVLRRLFWPPRRANADDSDSLGSDYTHGDTEVADDDVGDVGDVDDRLAQFVPASHARVEAAHGSEHSGEGSDDGEEGYESSFIDDGGDAPRRNHGAGRVRRRAPSVDLDRDHVIGLSDDDDNEGEEDVQFVGFGRRRAAPAAPRARGRGAIVITSDEEDDDEQERAHGRGSFNDEDRDGDDESDEDGDLAAEVAARERYVFRWSSYLRS